MQGFQWATKEGPLCDVRCSVSQSLVKRSPNVADDILLTPSHRPGKDSQLQVQNPQCSDGRGCGAAWWRQLGIDPQRWPFLGGAKSAVGQIIPTARRVGGSGGCNRAHFSHFSTFAGGLLGLPASNSSSDGAGDAGCPVLSAREQSFLALCQTGEMCLGSGEIGKSGRESERVALAVRFDPQVLGYRVPGRLRSCHLQRALQEAVDSRERLRAFQSEEREGTGQVRVG